MNRLYCFLILAIISCFTFISCSENHTDLKELRIIETEDAVLKYPSGLSLMNDSMLMIDDHDGVFSLNINTGELILMDENEKYMDECYTAIDKYNYFDDRIAPRDSYCIVSPHILSIDKNNADIKLVNVTTFEKKDSVSQIARPAIFVTSEKGIKLLLEKKDSTVKLSAAVPIGEICAYISDTLVIAPRISYFPKNTTPDTVPLLSVFSTDNEGDLCLEKLLYFKYEPKNNICNNDDEYDDCACLSSYSFYTDNGKIFFANGVNIYEYSNGEVFKFASPAKNRIVSFRFDDDTLYTIEEDSDKIYTANAYSLSTQKPIDCRYCIPAGLDVHTIDFIGKKLYVLYLEKESFYLLTIN